MPASAPVKVIPLTDTALPVPIFLLLNVAVLFTVKSSPDILLSVNVTVAVVLPSYTLFKAVALIVKLLTVILAVPVAVELVNV